MPGHKWPTGSAKRPRSVCCGGAVMLCPVPAGRGTGAGTGSLSRDRTAGNTWPGGIAAMKPRCSGIILDDATVTLLREHRKAQLAARLKAGQVWEDNDFVFCREDGSPSPPDYVSRRFKALAATAGVPVISPKDTGASLARDAEADPEIRQKTLGHTNARMTSHYTHIEVKASPRWWRERPSEASSPAACSPAVPRERPSGSGYRQRQALSQRLCKSSGGRGIRTHDECHAP